MARPKRKINRLIPQEEQQVDTTAKKYRTAGYVRLSVEDSGRPGSETLDGQKQFLRSYIESQPDLDFIGLWCDNGQTGTDFQRPQFEALMEKVKHGEINCICVKDLSRFGRNYKETGNYLERIFPFLGVRFIAINDNFDTLTAEQGANGYVVPLKNLINEVYSKDISRKSASALAVKQKRGEFIGAWAPYGYRKDPEDSHHLILNEETAPVVKRLFTLRVDGTNIQQIARQLDLEGILSPAAYLYEKGLVRTEKYKDVPWNAKVIKRILENPVYLGHMVQGKTRQSFYEGRPAVPVNESEWIRVENTHDALVDRETFDIVQQLAGESRTDYHRKLGKFDHLETHENILLGLVFCADCGRPLVRYKNVSHGKKLWYTYTCPRHSVNPSACPLKNIREDELLPLLLTTIQKQIALAVEMETLMLKVSRQPQNKTKEDAKIAELSSARQNLKKYLSLSENLYQSYVEKLIDENEFRILKTKYKSAIMKTETQIGNLEREIDEQKNRITENPYIQTFASFPIPQELTRETVTALIERILIHENKQVDILFKYPNEFTKFTDTIERSCPL